MKSKRILITGASGFIGSHIIDRIWKNNIVGVVTIKDEHLLRVKDSLKNVMRYNVDLKDTKGILKVLNNFKPDIVLHLASVYVVNHKSEQITPLMDTNVLGTANLLEASTIVGVKLFINTSTCFVYDEASKKVKEDYRLRPVNLYALTKINSEQLCEFYSDNYGLNCLTLRLFPPYGPRDNKRRLIPYVIDNCLSGKEIKLTSGIQKWDFIYVEDIVDAYELAMKIKLKGHEIVNIGSGKTIKVKEMVRLIHKHSKSRSKSLFGSIPHRKNEVWYCCADLMKAKKLLGWYPKTDIVSGIKKTINWHIQNGGLKNE